FHRSAVCHADQEFCRAVAACVTSQDGRLSLGDFAIQETLDARSNFNCLPIERSIVVIEVPETSARMRGRAAMAFQQGWQRFEIKIGQCGDMSVHFYSISLCHLHGQASMIDREWVLALEPEGAFSQDSTSVPARQTNSFLYNLPALPRARCCLLVVLYLRLE